MGSLYKINYQNTLFLKEVVYSIGLIINRIPSVVSALNYLRIRLCTYIMHMLELDLKIKVLLVHSILAKFPWKCQNSMIWKYYMDFQSLHLNNISDNWQTNAGRADPDMATSINPEAKSQSAAVVMLQGRHQARKASQWVRIRPGDGDLLLQNLQRKQINKKVSQRNLNMLAPKNFPIPIVYYLGTPLGWVMLEN